MKKRIIQLVFIFSLVSIKGYSCDCEVIQIQEAWEEAELIFKGKVVKIYSLPHLKTKEGHKGELYFHELVIQEVFSGSVENNDTILIAGAPGGGCDFTFSYQKEYIAFIPPYGLIKRTSHCDRTSEFKRFDKQDLKLLRELGNKLDLPKEKLEAIESNYQQIPDLIEKEDYADVVEKLRWSVIANVLLGMGLISLLIKVIYR